MMTEFPSFASIVNTCFYMNCGQLLTRSVSLTRVDSEVDAAQIFENSLSCCLQNGFFQTLENNNLPIRGTSFSGEREGNVLVNLSAHPVSVEDGHLHCLCRLASHDSQFFRWSVLGHWVNVLVRWLVVPCNKKQFTKNARSFENPNVWVIIYDKAALSLSNRIMSTPTLLEQEEAKATKSPCNRLKSRHESYTTKWPFT